MANGEDDVSDRGGIQVLSRAASILRELENEQDGLSLGELAGRLNLARSTVQRIVKALSDEQILMPASLKSRVKLGPLLVRLGSSAKLDVVQIAKPVMQELSRSLGETVDLSVLKGASALFIAQVAGTQRLSALSAAGEEFPLHSTANGKALLATLPAARRNQILRGRLRKDTDRTITSLTQIEQEIAQVMRDGVAFDRDEHTAGISAVGTWFTDATGRAYALSIPVPTLRFDEGTRLIQPLLQARDELLRRLAVH